MRPNIVTEAGLQTRAGQWWESIPFLTSAVVVVCGVIYLVCLLSGYDSFYEICFLPTAVVSHFQGPGLRRTSYSPEICTGALGTYTVMPNQTIVSFNLPIISVYRIYTSILFHGSVLHVLFNMLALVPLGSELERIMGSIRLAYLIILLATTNAIFHLFIALLVAHNPFHPYPYLMNECAIGFSGILFSMIVIETSLSGVQSRSVFGLFNVPAKWYAFILLVVFQLLMTNVSLLGHLCGILSGLAYIYGLFNFLMPGASLFSAIEASSWLSSCVRRPKFILCTGGSPTSYIPTYSGQNTTSSGLLTGNIWRNLSSWMPQRETSAQAEQDYRFPGRGRSLGSGQSETVPAVNSDSNLQARLLDNSNPDLSSHLGVTATREPLLDGRSSVAGNAVGATLGRPALLQHPAPSEEQIQKLVSMGFDKTQVEVAISAADGDLNVAVEILMSQQG